MTFTKFFGSIALAATALPLVMAASAASAQSAEMTTADLKARIASIVAAAYPADGPGAAVIVTRGGNVVYAAGQGLADVEKRQPITPDTAFPLGSIVKQFTAATVLQLVADGKMSLDDPISRFFPDWPQPGAKATVRQLLNHTSGIQDFSKIPGWIANNRTRAFTTAELLAVARDMPAKAQPGHAWEYNNGGYVMLGAIIENVTGKAWHQAMAERTIRPLGLRTIVHPLPGQVTGPLARGYGDDDGRVQPVPPPHPSVPHAAGGLVGSVSDVARWAQALHHDGVVSSALYQEMVRPAQLADGSTESYGFGLRLREIRGRAALVNGGAGAGLDTDSVYIPSEDLFVAVFANSDDPATDPSILTRRLASLALGEPIPTFTRAKVGMAAIEPLFGVYSAKDGPPLRFFARDGKLYVGKGDGQLEAFPAGDDRFFFGPDDLTWIRFVRQADRAHVVEVHRAEDAQPQRAVRTGAVPPPFTVAPAVLQTYVGTFQTETVAVTIALGKGGSLTLKPAGQDQMPLRPVSETEFRIDGTPMRLVFHKENGQVNRLTLYRGARELQGKRVSK
jgi:CubicO group peptidase (beta-lactamase class C family)